MDKVSSILGAIVFGVVTLYSAWGYVGYLRDGKSIPPSFKHGEFIVCLVLFGLTFCAALYSVFAE